MRHFRIKILNYQKIRKRQVFFSNAPPQRSIAEPFLFSQFFLISSSVLPFRDEELRKK